MGGEPRGISQIALFAVVALLIGLLFGILIDRAQQHASNAESREAAFRTCVSNIRSNLAPSHSPRRKLVEALMNEADCAGPRVSGLGGLSSDELQRISGYPLNTASIEMLLQGL